MLRSPNSNPASGGGLYVLRIYSPKPEFSRPNLRRFDQRSPNAPGRTQCRKIDSHKQIQTLDLDGVYRAVRTTSRRTIRKIPKKRIRARVCEEAPTGGKWAEILTPLPDPPLLGKDEPLAIIKNPLRRAPRAMSPLYVATLIRAKLALVARLLNSNLQTQASNLQYPGRNPRPMRS
jgi:hypothetical protein